MDEKVQEYSILEVIPKCLAIIQTADALTVPKNLSNIKNTISFKNGVEYKQELIKKLCKLDWKMFASQICAMFKDVQMDELTLATVVEKVSMFVIQC